MLPVVNGLIINTLIVTCRFLVIWFVAFWNFLLPWNPLLMCFWISRNSKRFRNVISLLSELLCLYIFLYQLHYHLHCYSLCTELMLKLRKELLCMTCYIEGNQRIEWILVYCFKPILFLNSVMTGSISLKLEMEWPQFFFCFSSMIPARDMS